MTTLNTAEARLREARETFADLVTRRNDVDLDAIRLGEEREKIAFAAHTGDRAAKKRLTEIHSEAARHASEIASLDAAVAEAKRRVADAEAAHVRGREADNARRVLALLDEFRAHGARLDAAAKALLAEYEAFKDTSRAIRSLGALPTSEHAIRVAMRRALAAALMRTDLEMDFLPPSDRHSFADLVGSWSRSIETWAAPRLADDEQQEAA